MPKAVKIRLCALSFAPIHYLSVLKKSYFHKILGFSKAVFIVLPKIIYLPLVQQIADLLTKIGLEVTLLLSQNPSWAGEPAGENWPFPHHSKSGQ